jgi:hypothetical protein
MSRYQREVWRIRIAVAQKACWSVDVQYTDGAVFDVTPWTGG